MNKKEIAEIRKQFAPERCAITKTCGCYVDVDKNIRTQINETFLMFPEEEMFKYLDIFMKTLSGRIGKNLFNLEYSVSDEEKDSPHNFLMELRDSKLQDDEILNEFYSRVIENYGIQEPYYIVLIHAVYDIPEKASDNKEIFDGSDNVYEFILCSICPSKLSKPGLSYDSVENRIENRIRDWVVDAPAHGFLFPAFNDRQTDIHGCLYYTKKQDDIQDGFMKEVIGVVSEISMSRQKEAFNKIIEAVFGDTGRIDEVLFVYERLTEIIVEAEYSSEEAEIDKIKMRDILFEASGGDWRMDRFDSAWDSLLNEDDSILVSNIVGKKLNIKCGNSEIKIGKEQAQLISERIINGVRYLVVPVNGEILVDGASVCCKMEVDHE